MKSNLALFAGLLVFVGLFAFFVAGNNNQIASFVIDTTDHALTLELDKTFFWSDWNVELTLRNNPKCQRRHILESSKEKSPTLEVYFPEPNFFIFRQSNHWYVADMKSCRFQEYRKPPPEPGRLIGTFQKEANGYEFIKKP
ncbi:conserved hypothetical protein [Gammaproteobacteria bacterium]